jgi:hypothetical protein
MPPSRDPRRVIHAAFIKEIPHLSLDEAVADFPLKHINTRPTNVPYTFWHLLEHIRIAQWDLLEYVEDPDLVSPDWPAGYWPAPNATTDAAGWKKTVAEIKKGVRKMDRMLADPKADIFAPVPFANDKSIARCAYLAIDHTSYHLGEFAILRQVMNLWPRNRRG